MPFTITRLETGINCPTDPLHKEGIYNLIFIKKSFQFYLCSVCTTIFIYNKTFGYVPLVENPQKRKLQTVTPEGALKLIQQAERKKKIFSGGSAKSKCEFCKHKIHTGKSCAVFIYKTINGKRKQTKCNCQG